MGSTRDKAREMLTQSHARFMAAIDQAKAEATKIQTLDELLGESTLAGVLNDPFVRGVTMSTSKPTLPALKLTERAKRTPKEPPKVQHKRGGRATGGPKISDKIRAVIQETPGIWLSVDEVNDAIAKKYGEPLKRGSLAGELSTICQVEGAWLQTRADGRLSKYSIVSSLPPTVSSTPDE